MTSRSQYRRLAAVSLLALCDCGARTDADRVPPAGTVRVVAIERVYGDLARQLGGDGVAVTTLLDSPTADPHDYEPTARDADAVSDADLVIENGLGYDAFARKLLAASPNAARTVLDAGTLGGHVPGENPHVWYDVRTMRRVVAAIADDLARRLPMRRAAIRARERALRAWIDRFSARLAAVAARRRGTRVAITEPVFDYVLHAAGLDIATPRSFSHAIEEGNDPAPQDVDAMQALLGGRHVAAFVYNSQTVETSTTNLLEIAKRAHVTIVPVTETLPENETTQAWLDAEASALARAL